MSERDFPAFPRPAGHSGTPGRQNNEQDGMTLRQWYAGQALAGLLACDTFSDTPKVIARICREHADAMLAELEAK